MTIEESDDEKSIVTPGLRLRFRWTGDRWTHFIDLGPGPEPDDGWPWSIDRKMGQWLTIAEAIEWDGTRDDPRGVVSPVFQDLQFHTDKTGTYALLVGQSGPHHFSGSFRIWDEFAQWSETLENHTGLDCYNPRVTVDIADRCVLPIVDLAATYQLRPPFDCDPFSSLVDDCSEDIESLVGIPSKSIGWGFELRSCAHHDFICATDWRKDSPDRVTVIGGEYGPWQARIGAGSGATSKTRRLGYSWGHNCSTPKFMAEWRRRDPARDAFLRRLEASIQGLLKEAPANYNSRELRELAARHGIDFESLWV